MFPNNNTCLFRTRQSRRKKKKKKRKNFSPFLFPASVHISLCEFQGGEGGRDWHPTHPRFHQNSCQKKKKSFFLHFLFEGSRELFIRTLRGESAFYVCRRVSFYPSMKKKNQNSNCHMQKIWLATFILKMLLATKKGKRKTQSLKQSVWTSRFLRALL